MFFTFSALKLDNVNPALITTGTVLSTAGCVALPPGSKTVAALALAALPFWKRVKLAGQAAQSSWKETAR